MGLRRLTFLLLVSGLPLALTLAACGDNNHHQIFEDAGIDMGSGGGSDAAIDAPPDALMCGANQMICNSVCVNTQTDNNNCGTCGTSCGTGTCQQGLCCPAGQTNCGGTCVDLSQDETHCGACATTCTTGQTCQNGTCCGAGTTVCGNQCFDTQTDEQHCGGCNTACNAGETCESGICCPTGQVNCNGVCKDLNTDETACGACTTSCTTGQTCSSGTCCTTGQTSCGGVCKDLNTDETACGDCNTTCTTGQTCTTTSTNTNPKCCTTGQNNCGGTCSDPMTDSNNCGTCGHACATGESCSAGICCGPGETNCNGVCVDKLTDATNCGTCGTTCSGTTSVCNGGVCAGSCDTSAGYQSCNGNCVNTQTDHNNCGTCGTQCAANQVCNAGTCTTMCGSGQMNCGGSCVDVGTDPNHCGTCSNVCPLADECVAGMCQKQCPSGESLCGGPNGTCHNLNNDETACGNCNTQCGTGQQCLSGVCCGSNQINCGGVCKTPTTDPNNCGGCGITCSSGQSCTSGSNGGKCCATGDNNCNNQCSDPQTDQNNCGGCGIACSGSQSCSLGKCCTTGTVNMGGICCLPNELNCGGVCINPQTDHDNCNTCNHVCAGNEYCSSGTCTTQCNAPNNLHCGYCTNTDSDPDACGNGTTGQDNCADCPTGAACLTGKCQTCTQADPTKPDVCNNACTNTLSDSSNCGTCNHFCQSGETCQSGICCGSGLSACSNQCVNLQDDEQHCGTCTNVCGAGSTCTNGACVCGFGQNTCPPAANKPGCHTTSVDPTACGPNCVTCGAGQVCVSGGCVDTCPPPPTGNVGLVECPAGSGNPYPECVNIQSDNNNCGGCNIKCPTGQGCVATTNSGQCVPKLTVGTDPAKCVGGGPPISVPTGGGQQTCSGNLASSSFTFALCARTNIGPVSRDVLTDAFDSNVGPYKSSCTSDADCGGTLKCIGDPANGYAKQCAGGGVGVNGRLADDTGSVSPVFSNSATTSVGGDFWLFGTAGLAIKGDTRVNQRLIVEHGVDVSKTSRVFGISSATQQGSYVNGPWTSGGNSSLRFDPGPLTTTSCGSLPSSVVTAGGCNSAAFPAALPSQALPCGTKNDLIPVRDIVEYFRDPAHNDNLAIGLSYSALDNPPSATHVDLPCGYYYFHQINGGQPITIRVHGRTAVFVGGAVRISQQMVFDLDPTASLDIFVGGVVNVSNNTTLGSPAFPRLTRLYVGNSSCLGSGNCTQVSDCCSGTCSACPEGPFGACTGTGVCGANGGGNLSQAISLSQGGYFNGLLWAGYGAFTHSNPLEMYGSVFANYFDASGVTTLHYDNGAVETGTECPAPSGSCESCRDCNNQACKNNTCTSCTADSDCCPPLHCDTASGSCKL